MSINYEEGLDPWNLITDHKDFNWIEFHKMTYIWSKKLRYMNPNLVKKALEFLKLVEPLCCVLRILSSLFALFDVWKWSKMQRNKKQYLSVYTASLCKLIFPILIWSACYCCLPLIVLDMWRYFTIDFLLAALIITFNNAFVWCANRTYCEEKFLWSNAYPTHFLCYTCGTGLGPWPLTNVA